MRTFAVLLLSVTALAIVARRCKESPKVDDVEIMAQVKSKLA